ncbi:MAG: MerR family transcriptional regulator [Fidelibacterota bacterium]|nr:MAG: MerR family transcriptional regulator [Candidatus Neomarinimicrobiota bacterium]
MSTQDIRSESAYATIDRTTPLYTIGIAAQLTGTTVSTIRMYEEKGLVIPHKAPSGHRQFSDSDIVRLRCIREHLDKRGLNIAGIKTLMSLVPCWVLKPCSEEDQQSCDAYTTSMEPCWMVSRKGPECETADCRTCSVYHIPDRCHDLKALYKGLIMTGEVPGDGAPTPSLHRKEV